MQGMLKRAQTEILQKYLKKFPVVAVVGGRQVGKTTLVRYLLKEKRKYFTFDDAAVVVTAKDGPEAFLTQNSKITVDEVQKLPEILSTLKKLVDEKRIPGRFILTGSANLLMLPKVRESLAGRAVYIELEPLTIFEAIPQKLKIPKIIEMLKVSKAGTAWEKLSRLKPRKIPFKDLILRGGYPDPWLEKDNALRNAWFKAYIKSYLERDIRDISQIRNLHDFRKFLALAAFRSGQILSKSDLSRDAGISYSTAAHFFNLLLASFQIFTIEPYYRNIGKRLIKAPKLMWNDTGLAIHLQGLARWQDLERLGRVGHLLENKLAIELKALLSIFLPEAKLFYWRTSGGAEVDFVIENRGQVIPVEVKWAEKVSRYDLRGIESFLKDFKGSSEWGMVIYRGRNLLKIRENIFLVPLNYLF
ncbi:MAG: ATP-binding protein [Candidatus Margulisiibacteriota bacterium]|nr:ATP-binding protein [Candidatus Margulisiibacteriota bacterium]